MCVQKGRISPAYKLCVISLLLLITSERASAGFMVDPQPPYHWLPGGQYKPAISAGTHSFFAVWQDARTGINHIYGTRISKDGVVLDTCGILISGGSWNKYDPAVGFGYTDMDGDNYLAVWRDSMSLRVARIKKNEVIDTLGITIMSEEVYSPAVAYDGTFKYMVVWGAVGGDIKGKTVDVNGNVSGLFIICAESGNQVQPKVSFNGTNFFVVWADNRSGDWRIYGARVTPNGTVLDAGGIDLVNTPGVRYSPDVGFCGGYWLCVWEDTMNGNRDIYGTRVDADGNVLDVPSIQISEGSFYDEYHPAVSSDGDKFIVTYIENYWDKDVINALVQSDGTVLSHHYTSNSLVTSRTWTDVAFCDNVFFSLWCHYQPYRYGIVGTRIDKDGNFLDGWYCINVGITATIQNKPVCAFGGDSALVVWEDNSDGIVGEMINLTGTPLKKINFAFLERNPAIGYTDPYYFCVWHGCEIDSTIKGRRITRDGVAMPETINIVDSISYTPCIDVDGGAGTFCVGWIDPDYPRGVYCSNQDTGGVIVQPPINISNTPPSAMGIDYLSVCFNDSNYNYLIAWHEMTDMFDDSIYCTMVSKTGGILYQRVPLGSGEHPSLTFDGTNYFCVWQGGIGLVGQWISIAAEPGDSCLIPFYILKPQVNFCGDGYIITGERDGKVLGVKLSLTGSIIDSFEVGDGKQPSVAAIRDKYFLTWSSFTPYPYSSYRIWGEFGSFIGVEKRFFAGAQNDRIEVYPNPFTQKTVIEFRVGNRHACSLQIYDLGGRVIRTLPIANEKSPIIHIVWDSRAQNGKIVRPGIYFIKANGYKTVKVAKLR